MNPQSGGAEGPQNTLSCETKPDVSSKKGPHIVEHAEEAPAEIPTLPTKTDVKGGD
jgi:hypothetical protein